MLDESIRKVLCVCTANMCRSPMLQALLQKACDEQNLNVVVESAGIFVHSPVPPTDDAVFCMKERHLDISTHRSRHVLTLDLNEFDRIYCLDYMHADYLRSKGVSDDVIHVVNDDQGGVADPVGLGRKEYKECSQVLEKAAAEICESIKSLS